MNGTDAIEVACALDVTRNRDYALMLGVLVASLAENHLDPRPLTIRVFHRGATLDLQQQIEQPATARGIAVRWTELDDNALARLGSVVSHGFAASYLKLLIPELVPPEVTHLVYLDVDIVVLEDIARLWSVQLDGAIAACCVDGLMPTLGQSWIRPDCDTAARLDFLTSLGLDPAAPYFNAGVLSIDVRQWRSAAVARRVIEYAERYASQNRDQDGLNVVLSGAWRRLDPRWNVFPRLSADFAEPPPDPPHAIHFCWYKPMAADYETRYIVSPSKTAFRRIFHDYLARTAFAAHPGHDVT